MDLSKCKCKKSRETDPAGHVETCPYRLAYDEIVIQVPLSPEELNALAMAMSLAKHHYDRLDFAQMPPEMASVRDKINQYALAGQRMRAGVVEGIQTQE